jgi:hypothetical protein
MWWELTPSLRFTSVNLPVPLCSGSAPLGDRFFLELAPPVDSTFWTASIFIYVVPYSLVWLRRRDLVFWIGLEKLLKLVPGLEAKVVFCLFLVLNAETSRLKASG